MTSKEKLILTIVSEVLITVIVVAVIYKRPTEPKSVAGVQTARVVPTNAPMTAQAASMDDHHGKPQPAETTVFDSLLGKPAPDFTLESYDGKKVTLSSLRGKKVVLFFNEGLMCYPACWNQIAAFSKDSELLQKAVILNINVDPKKDWAQAIVKMPELAGATVLLDGDRKVTSAYGVLTTASSMHRGQYPGHSFVVIDKDGVVRFAWDDPQMAVRNKEILAELAKI